MIGTREIHLTSRPFGRPTQENFTLVETELSAPSDGQVLVLSTHKPGCAR